ncbi:MAG: division/cell wall cluster transcriptional repressor MraZ [Candidatus Contendobacter odensis]|uniref:Transcriptional regulator MraZ n=1 Tax=Candidatus Contendibacter odensensis TaxID=1400860 RepID=A0A2G6PHI8_9GAMM|nr:MAG: division/cell wall cluster transcriptional repressor MraZ [Candidatus Contendobacter odensis]
MTTLLGEYDCKLDSKSRIALPAALRKQLPPEAEGRFVVNRGFEQHLVFYPLNEWRRVTAEINKLNLYVRKNRDFVRYFHRGATELELDSSGRLLLPRRLLSYASIHETVILLAYANRIECWDTRLYDDLLTDEPADFAGLAEEIMGHDKTMEQHDSLEYRVPFMPPGSRH